MLRWKLSAPGLVRLIESSQRTRKLIILIFIDGLHVGGGITAENAQYWIEQGAEKVIVTSYLFPDAKFSLERLQDLCKKVGKDRLVVDVR